MKTAKTMTVATMALAMVLASAQTDQYRVRVMVDGQRVHFRGQQPMESNGRVLVPLRGVFERLGATADWDPATETITARKNEALVELTIGRMDASVDHQGMRMDVAPTLIGGATMVPLRFVSEALGAYVTWDETNHEVDISSTTDYNLPRRPPTQQPPPPTPPTPPPTIIVQTPPPPPPVTEVRPIRITHNYREIAADTVIPMTLNTRLSSRDSRPGDQFSATIDTNGAADYMGLPAGTEAYGTVSYVRHQHRRSTGVIELNFDHLILPNGRNIAVNGRLTAMDDEMVRRRDDGVFVAARAQRSERTVFAGYENGVVIGLATRRPLQDAKVDELITASVGQGRYRLAHDVEVRTGTRMGIRLYEAMLLPHDER